MRPKISIGKFLAISLKLRDVPATGPKVFASAKHSYKDGLKPPMSPSRDALGVAQRTPDPAAVLLGSPRDLDSIIALSCLLVNI